jgi:hypothetical protein
MRNVVILCLMQENAELVNVHGDLEFCLVCHLVGIRHLLKLHGKLNGLQEILLPIFLDEVLISPEKKLHRFQPHIFLILAREISREEFIRACDPVDPEFDDIKDFEDWLVLILQDRPIEVFLLPLPISGMHGYLL